MLARVFAPDLDPTRMRAELPSDESEHLTRVLRLRAGARVLAFDGRGAQYLAEIEVSSKRGVTLALLEPAPAARESRVRLVLAQAALKGDKMETVIRDATMMGVASIVPLVTMRTVVPWTAVEQGRVRDRWHRVAVASAKQCGRAVVPAIAAPLRWEALVAAATAERAQHDEPALRLWLAEPAVAAEAGDALGSVGSGTAMIGAREAAAGDASMREPAPWASAVLPAQPPAHAILAIGPEGGWAAEEAAAARAAGWHAWTLGDRTLRAESAPLAALAVLTYVWAL